jgi:hypothetical protein
MLMKILKTLTFKIIYTYYVVKSSDEVSAIIISVSKMK